MRRIRCQVIQCVLAGVLCLFTVLGAVTLPTQLTDAAFWKMITEFSEPDGYFQLENSCRMKTPISWSSRSERGHPARRRLHRSRPGTEFHLYRPRSARTMSFIIDIRRQNLLEHLLYKSLFEMSADRADFIGRLFSRKRPGGLSTRRAFRNCFKGYASTEADEKLYDSN